MIITINITDFLLKLGDILAWATVLKVIFIGGEFNLLYWFKYGREYCIWYKEREQFSNYLARVYPDKR